MEFSIKAAQPGRSKTGCAVVGVFETTKLSSPAMRLNEAANGYIATLLRRGDMSGKTGSTLLLHEVPGVAAERVLLVGLGKEADFSARQYREAIAAAVRAVNGTGARDAEIHLTATKVNGHDAAWRTRQAVIAARETLYRFDAMKSRRETSEPALAQLTLVVEDKGELRSAQRGGEQGAAIADGMVLTKDLGNLPPNVCTPSYLANQARELAKSYGMKAQVFDLSLIHI